MKVLVTGALGNIGISVVDELYSRGHSAVVFDLKNKKSKKKAVKIRKVVKRIHYGDILNQTSIDLSIKDCECVIHLAAVIPPLSENNPELCDDVNVKGTMNLIAAINDTGRNIPLIYTSTASVMGPTQLNIPPVNTSQIPNPVTYYSKSKLKAENLLIQSGIRSCILRLASVMDSGTEYSDDMLKLLFDFPLDARNEIVLDLDAAAAIVRAAELATKTNLVDNRTFFIGGGYKNGCQIINKDLVSSLFVAMGIGRLSEDCFIKDRSKYSMDWYDTKESNEILEYQMHSFNDYIEIIKKRTKSGGPVVKYMAPRLKKVMELQSPYYKDSNKE